MVTPPPNYDESPVVTAASWPTKTRHWLIAFRDYIHNAGVEIILSGLGFVSGILVARWLGPTGRGQLGAAMLWPGIIAIVISLGLQHAFTYAVGVGWASPARLQRLALRFAMLAAVPAMAVYWFLCPWILYKQFPGQQWIPGVFALYIPLAVYAGLLLSLYQGSGDFIRWNIGRLFRSGAWTLWVIISAAVAGLTVLNLLLVQIAILAILGVYLFSQLAYLRERNKEDETVSLRSVFNYGFAIYISTIAYSVTQQFDQLLLSLWVIPSELGQYMIAVTVAGIILLIPSAVGPIVFSKIARAVDKPTEQRDHIWLAFHLIVKLMVPAGLCLTILAPWVTQILYGPAYAKAGDVLRVLAPATIFLGAGVTLSDILRGAGKPMYATCGALAGAAITILGLVWALPRFGIWGAAWVSFIAYAAMMLIQAFLLWRWMTKSSPSTRTLKGI